MVCYRQVQFCSKERGYETKPFCVHGGDGNRLWSGVFGVRRGPLRRERRHAGRGARLLRQPEDEDRGGLRVPGAAHAPVAPLRRGGKLGGLRVPLHQQRRRLFVVLEKQQRQLYVDVRARDDRPAHDHARRTEQEDSSGKGRQCGDQPDDVRRHGHRHIPARALLRRHGRLRHRRRQQVQGEDLFVQDLRERRAGDGPRAVARDRRLVCAQGRRGRQGLLAHDGQPARRWR